MIGTIIVSYLIYMAVSSWIFWALIGALLCFVGIVVSPGFRLIFSFIVAYGLIMFYHANF